MRRIMLIAFGLMAMSVGCSGDEPPTKAGGSAPPVTLTAVAPAPAGFPGGDQLLEFARQVDTISGGSLTIDISKALDVSRSDNDITAIGMVRNGQIDVGVIPARAFDLAGMTSLRALQAPFLVNSSALADMVLGDQISQDMLAGLSPGGLTGLALNFDALRHPIGFEAPLQSLSDYDGATIGVPQSRTSELMFEALGATTTDIKGDSLETAIIEGSVNAVEDSVQVPTAPAVGIATGNEVLFLKANAIVVDSKVFGGLTTDQQSVLRQAAEATHVWAAQEHPDDAAGAAAYCAAGHGDVVIASQVELEELRTASQSVYDALESDDLTHRAITRIEELASELPVQAPIEGCVSSRDDAAEGTGAAAGDQSAIDGVWRLEVALDANADRPDAARDASLNNGTWTWTFRSGSFDYLEPRGRRAKGTYVIEGDRLSMVETDGTTWDFVIQRTGDSMAWHGDPARPVDPLLEEFVSGGLVRVGNAP